MIADYITRNLSYNITQKYPKTTELIKQQTDGAFSSPEKNDLDSFFRKHPFFTTLKKNRSDFDKSFCYPPNEPCPDCKVLTKLMNKYLDIETFNSVIIN